MISRSKTNLFALIIGINAYGTAVESGPLKRAVDDSNSLKSWLLTKLNVPESRIQVLQNQEATRGAIIKALKDLSENERIKRDDPILIYYAGYGSQAEAPAKVQMILPYDYGHADATDRATEGIPERTLGVLLSNIAKNKGNNITVILDCCYSGSGTRTHLNLRPRGVPYKGIVPGDLDADLIEGTGTRGIRVLEPFRNARSHVLLTACAPDETAYEDEYAGVFTRALLIALEDVDITKTSNTVLLQYMDIKQKQTPQCDGQHRSRLLFDVLSKLEPVYRACWNGPSELTISVGSMNGIQPGCTFRVWKSGEDPKSQNTATLTVTAHTIEDFHLVAQADYQKDSTPDQTSPFFAQILNNPRPKIGVHVPEEIQGSKWYLSLFEDRQPLEVDMHADITQATVGLTYLKGPNSYGEEEVRIGFKILTPTLNEQDQEIKYTIPPDADDLYQALDHLCHYFYHRDRRPTLSGEENVQLSSHINFTMFTLKETEEYCFARSQDVTVGPPDDRCIELTIGEENEDECYGFEITNTSNLDVFPHLCYFNTADFSIVNLYMPVARDSTAAPIPLAAGGSLTVGYGSGGTPPIGLSISEGLQFERGCFRLFIATQPVDLSFMEQGDIAQGVGRRGREVERSETSRAFWDCITIPIVVRREVIAPSISPMIGVIGAKRSGKATVLQELFTSLDQNPQPTSESPSLLIKEYDIAIPIPGADDPPIDCTLVDLPAFEDADIHSQAETLKELVAYLGTQHRERQFIALIWCLDISSVTLARDVDKLNNDLVKDITGEEMFENVVVLTTHWNNGEKAGTNKAAHGRSFAAAFSPLKRWEANEQRIKSQDMDFRPLVEGRALFMRFGVFSDPEMAREAGISDPLTVLQTVVTQNSPGTLQVQYEVSETNVLSKTTAGKKLHDRLGKEIEREESVLKDLRDKLKDMERAGF